MKANKQIPNSNNEFNEFNVKFFSQLSVIIFQITGHTPLGISEAKPILEEFLTPYSLNDLGFSLKETIETALNLMERPIKLPPDFDTWFRKKPDRVLKQKPTYFIFSKENLKRVENQFDLITEVLTEKNKKYKIQKLIPEDEYKKTCLRVAYKTEVIVDIKLPRFNDTDTEGSFYFVCLFFPNLTPKKLLLQQFKELIFKPLGLSQTELKKTFFLNAEDLLSSLNEIYPLLNKINFYE